MSISAMMTFPYQCMYLHFAPLSKGILLGCPNRKQIQGSSLIICVQLCAHRLSICGYAQHVCAQCKHKLSIRMSTPKHSEHTLTLFQLKKTNNYWKMLNIKKSVLDPSDGSKMKQEQLSFWP